MPKLLNFWYNFIWFGKYVISKVKLIFKKKQNKMKNKNFPAFFFRWGGGVREVGGSGGNRHSYETNDSRDNK